VSHESPPALLALAPAGSLPPEVLELLGGSGPIAVYPTAAALPLDGDPSGGVVLLAPELPAEELQTVIRRVASHSAPWIPLQLEGGEGGMRVRPISVGTDEPLEAVAERLAHPDGHPPILDLRHVLQAVARARHDINNPLTSALAEVQLLLMDHSDVELRESLLTVQSQLRRIRDMVLALTRLRPYLS